MPTDTPLPLDEPAGEESADGAMIIFRRKTRRSVTIEIKDNKGASGKYSSADAPVKPDPKRLRFQVIGFALRNCFH
jgi:hypothetical protein